MTPRDHDRQRNLFDAGPGPPANYTDTSQAAAAAIATRAPSIRERVFVFIRERCGRGATNEEISLAMGLRIQTVCGRTNELQGNYVLPRRIQDSGYRRTNESGRDAIVWEVRP